MSSETPVNDRITPRNTRTSPIYQNCPNIEVPNTEISQPQPVIELTPPSPLIRSPLRQRPRRTTESYEDLIGGQATFEIGQSSGQEMPCKNVEPNSPSYNNSDSSIPEIPNNLSSPNSLDYNVNTHDSIWTRLYQQAIILDVHTEQLKDLQPMRLEWYDRNLDTLFRRADAERRAVFDLEMKVGEIKDKTDQELGNLDSRI